MGECGWYRKGQQREGGWCTGMESEEHFSEVGW